MSTPVQIILGAGGIGSPTDAMAGHTTPSTAQAFLNIFRSHGHTTIDIARGYSPGAPGTSEPLLGQTDFAAWATIDTKASPRRPGSFTADGLRKSMEESLSALGVTSEFGLSNYPVSQVETFIEQAEKNGWVKPTVYQGQYNAVCREAERELLPLLRKNRIRFYAYSPAAGGFFGKKLRRGLNTRIGVMTKDMYSNEAMAKILVKLKEISGQQGVSAHSIAIRWALFHSALRGEEGDGIVVGARSDEQLEQTLRAAEEGGLEREVVKLVERCWRELEGSGGAPGFVFGSK